MGETLKNNENMDDTWDNPWGEDYQKTVPEFGGYGVGRAEAEEEQDENIIQELKNETEKFCVGVARGELEQTDEQMHDYLLGLLKNRCKEYGVSDYSDNQNELCNSKLAELCEKTNRENGTSFNYNFEEFDRQFRRYLEQVNNIPSDKRVFYFDALTHLGIKGPVYSIFDEMNSELNVGKLTGYLMGLVELEKRKPIDDPEVVAIFGEETPHTPTKEEQVEAREMLEEFITKYGLSKDIYTKRKKRANELRKMREAIYMGVAMEENPEYVAELEQLKSNQDVTYYFHGSDGRETSQKINEQGLFMQYGDMDRTAVPSLSPYELMNYSYGHDGMGQHAITIIAVPKGDYAIEANKDNVEVVGTGQGYAGIESFAPKYVIPKRYIYGYIDKDNKQVVKNPEYVDIDKKRNSV